MKKSWRLILAALALGLLALLWSFTPQRLPLSNLPIGTLPSAHPPAAMSLSALPTGSMSSKAAFSFRGGAFEEARQFAMTAVLIRHPQGDLLFDTGLGRLAQSQYAEQPWLMHQISQISFKSPAIDQLLAAGYDLRQLAGVVPTHAHWDHVSGVPDFAGVPIWLNAAEDRFIETGGMVTDLARSFGAFKRQHYEFQPAAYLGFERSLDVWGDGSVVLVPAPGHTPGSVLVFVTLPSQRRYVLLGDLVWQMDGIERPAERPWVMRVLVDDDAAEVRATISHIAALRQRFPDITWLPAHDAQAMDALPVFPAQVQ